jgi:hypothetical protein
MSYHHASTTVLRPGASIIRGRVEVHTGMRRHGVRKYMDFWILRAGCTIGRQLDDGHCKLSLSSLRVIHIILP